MTTVDQAKGTAGAGADNAQTPGNEAQNEPQTSQELIREKIGIQDNKDVGMKALRELADFTAGVVGAVIQAPKYAKEYLANVFEKHREKQTELAKSLSREGGKELVQLVKDAELDPAASGKLIRDMYETHIKPKQDALREAIKERKDETGLSLTAGEIRKLVRDLNNGTREAQREAQAHITLNELETENKSLENKVMESIDQAEIDSDTKELMKKKAGDLIKGIIETGEAEAKLGDGKVDVYEQVQIQTRLLGKLQDKIKAINTTVDQAAQGQAEGNEREAQARELEAAAASLRQEEALNREGVRRKIEELV